MLIGRTLKEVVTLLVQAVLIMVPRAVRVPAGTRVAGLAVLVVLGVGLGSLSFALVVQIEQVDFT